MTAAAIAATLRALAESDRTDGDALTTAADYIDGRLLRERQAHMAALRLIIVLVPALAGQAATVMQEPDDERRQLQLDRLAVMAIRKLPPSATAEDRQRLADAIRGAGGVTTE